MRTVSPWKILRFVVFVSTPLAYLAALKKRYIHSDEWL
jgi:hypothetical protein